MPSRHVEDPSERPRVRALDANRDDALRQSEQRFRLLIEAIRDYAIFLLDREGNVVTWNEGAERFKGYRAEEIIGRHFSCFYRPEDIESRKPQRELEIAEREGAYEEEGWRIRKDGSRFWANVVITALRDEKGTLVGFGEVTRDLTERLKANEQFRTALEAAPTGMIMVDQSGQIVLVNAQIEKLFGHARVELVGKPVEMLVPERFRGRHPEFRTAFFSNPKARPMGSGRDLYGLRKDGTEVPIEIGLNPLRTTEGDFVLSSIVDIAERKRSEREREELLGQLRSLNTELEERVRLRTVELSATLKEREVLLQEVHHRVKNNLQVISSLINMQLRRLTDSSSRDALEECQTRIQAIALIHEKLYQSRDYARVPFPDYVQSLASNVFHATGVSPGVVLDLAIDNLSLAVDKAIPCGLILNELITNATKHAFPGERAGIIRVEMRQGDAGRISLVVQDDGVGLREDIDISTSQSLGMQLITILAQQLDAEIEVKRERGTLFQVAFDAGD